MKAFVKTVMLSGLGIGCLALGSGAQTPAPAPPPAPPGSPAVVVSGQTVVPTPPVPGLPGGGVFMRSGDRTTWAVVVAEDAKAIELARKMVDAKDEDDKGKIKKQLKEALNKAFDERQKRQEREIAELEAKVKKLKELVSKRKENRDEIIEERIRQLERDASGLGW